MISIERFFTVMADEVDEHGALTAQSLQRYFQIVADRHSEILGCGWDDMRNAAAFWVISRIRIEIYQRPTVNEIIHVRTWPNPASASGVMRNYLVENSKHEVIAKGMALWSVVNMITDKGMKATEFPLLNQSLPYSTEKVFPDDFERMNILFDLQDPILTRQLQYRFMDKNGHVNNTFYITGVEKSINHIYDPNFHATNYQINYRSPLFAEEIIRLHLKKDGTFYYGEAFVLRQGVWVKTFQIKLK
jgi:acyl-ACP thioesterase